MHDLKVKVFITQSCLTLCDAMDYSLTGSSVHGILQARILKLVAMPFSRGIFQIQGSNRGLPHYKQILYHLSHQGSPYAWFCPHKIFEEHRKLLQAELGCVSVPTKHRHIHILRHPPVTLYFGWLHMLWSHTPSISGARTFHSVSDNPASTASQLFTSWNCSNPLFHRQCQYNIYCSYLYIS